MAFDTHTFEEERAESSITDVQKKLTEFRLANNKEIESKTGMPGHLEYVNGQLVGEVRGHQIDLGGRDSQGKIRAGTVDGMEVSQETSAEIMGKYVSMAYKVGYLEDEKTIEAIKGMIRKENLQKAVDDLMQDNKAE
jgi:hypothetical protein